MLRMFGDNGKLNDNMLMHVLSPYPAHRSALTDCEKLARSALPGGKAIVIFGYDYEGWAMDPAIEAFETLASERVTLGVRHAAGYAHLVHPSISAGGSSPGKSPAWQAQRDDVHRAGSYLNALAIQLRSGTQGPGKVNVNGE